MGHIGMRGAQGWSSDDSPEVIELVQTWNKLAHKCGCIYGEDRIPPHLVGLNQAINGIRQYVEDNPKNK